MHLIFLSGRCWSRNRPSFSYGMFRWSAYRYKTYHLALFSLIFYQVYVQKLIFRWRKGRKFHFLLWWPSSSWSIRQSSWIQVLLVTKRSSNEHVVWRYIHLSFLKNPNIESFASKYFDWNILSYMIFSKVSPRWQGCDCRSEWRSTWCIHPNELLAWI